MLESLRERLQKAFETLRGTTVVDREAVKAFVQDLQRALLVADVDVRRVLEISEAIEEKALAEDIPPGLTRKEHIVKIVYDELASLMGEETPLLEIPKGRTTVLLAIGIQGSGKTTTCAKLAYHFLKGGYKVGLASTDTFRPAAQEQLRQLASEISCPFYEAKSEKPKEIAEMAVAHFKSGNFDVMILDTAGRHKEEKELLEEMKQIAEAAKPDFTFLVLDGTIGQQAYPQAKAFHETTPVGGVVITKLDGTAKGGGALSGAAATGSHVYFIGTGEKIADLEPYNPRSFVGRLLGLGDLDALMRKIREVEDVERMKRRMERLAKGRFTLVDLIEQLEGIRRMGSLTKILDLIPGMKMKLPKELAVEAEEKAKKWKHILNSMTDEERIQPELVKSRRVKRISRGAGVQEKEVKDLLKQFFAAKRMMKSRQGRRLMKMLRAQGIRPEDLMK